MDLYNAQVEKYGVDNNTIRDPYIRILYHKLWCIRCIGKGPPPLKGVNSVRQHSPHHILNETNKTTRIQVEVECQIAELFTPEEYEYKFKL